MEQNKKDSTTVQDDKKHSSQEWDKLSAEAEKETKTKKPGSQSNHSKQHNNGRGGGK